MLPRVVLGDHCRKHRSNLPELPLNFPVKLNSTEQVSKLSLWVSSRPAGRQQPASQGRCPMAASDCMEPRPRASACEQQQCPQCQKPPQPAENSVPPSHLGSGSTLVLNLPSISTPDIVLGAQAGPRSNVNPQWGKSQLLSCKGLIKQKYDNNSLPVWHTTL